MAKKMLVFCGSDEPQKVFPPFMLGCGAQAVDMELTLFFTLSGLNIIRKGRAEEIELSGAPNTLVNFLNIVRDNGARLIACSAAFPIVGVEEDDFIDGVEFGGVAEFVSLAEEADVVLTFC
jgi:predicted peroxiredoxin